MNSPAIPLPSSSSDAGSGVGDGPPFATETLKLDEVFTAERQNQRWIITDIRPYTGK